MIFYVIFNAAHTHINKQLIYLSNTDLNHIQLLVNIWAIGRDTATWPDPLKFKPERFFQEDIDFRGCDFELIPFGAGRRICPGLPLAYRMVHLMLGSLLHRFKWKLPEGEANSELDMSEKFGVTLVMARNLKAIAVPVHH
jgi:geraniol 8-hydroxylase